MKRNKNIKAAWKYSREHKAFKWIKTVLFICDELIKRKRKPKGNQEWTIQRNWQYLVHKAHDEENTEKLATFGTQGTRRRQYRETGNIWYTRHTTKTIQKHNTICVGYHYTQTNTNNVDKIWALLQTTGGNDELNINLIRKS